MESVKEIIESKLERVLESYNSPSGYNGKKYDETKRAVDILTKSEWSRRINGSNECYHTNYEGIDVCYSDYREKVLTLTKDYHGHSINCRVREFSKMIKRIKKIDMLLLHKLYCEKCNRKHWVYGIEVEIVGTYLSDKLLENEFLRYANNKSRINSLNETIGLDGAGVIEIRNINANTPKGIGAKYDSVLRRLKSSVIQFKNKYDRFVFRTSTERCGTHVHYYSKDKTLNDRAICAMGIVAAVVNAENVNDWQSRLDSGYGKINAYRTSNAFCTNTIELRSLNSLTPTMVTIALEFFNELIKVPEICLLKNVEIPKMLASNSSESIVFIDNKNYYSYLASAITQCKIDKEIIKRYSKVISDNYKTMDEEFENVQNPA